MKIKLMNLNVARSRDVYNQIKKHKEIEMNDCYFNTLFVAKLLQMTKQAKGVKVVIGFIQGVSDNAKGYEDWQYNTYVRHAFLVDAQNKVIDIAFMHLESLGIENLKATPKYVAMKKYTVDEFIELAENKLNEGLSNSLETLDLTFREFIPYEPEFMAQMRKQGLLVVKSNKGKGTVDVLN